MVKYYQLCTRTDYLLYDKNMAANNMFTDNRIINNMTQNLTYINNKRTFVTNNRHFYGKTQKSKINTILKIT
jgi:hypothetical protein